MSPWKSSVPAALLGIAIAAGGLYGTRHGRATEIARLRETNRKLRIAISATKPIAPVTTAEIPPTLPTKPAEPASPATPVDRGDYRFAGNATPQATLQTFAWACDKMDT
ncbi:MAG TPA: hypothetical protein VFJ90_12335, partial [Candidatus Didemnitutus sp.]|nr:hypothetical protein [Candidatus Didemnitutus sp.]